MVAEAGASPLPAGSPTRLRDLLRNIPQQIRLALGIRGVGWATAAGLVGLLSCAASFAYLALSLNHSDVAHRKDDAARVFPFEDTSRELIRSVFARSAGASVEGVQQYDEAWSRFDAALAAGCGTRTAQDFDDAEFGRLCALRPVLAADRPAIQQTLAAGQPAPPTAVRHLIEMRVLVSAVNAQGLRRHARLLDDLIEGSEWSFLALLVSTVGFVSAGLVLILLVGHTALRLRTHWHEAARARARAERTLQLLQETVDTVPAGIVVYDTDNRLLLFNSMAASINPQLKDPGSIGKTYAELAQAVARLREEAGISTPDDGPEHWIARYNSRGKRMRHEADGRWVEWSERATPSGRTVGLRVDVTALKTREIEIERMRDEYESLVASLSDMVFKLELKSGRLTFVSAAAIELFGVSPRRLMERRGIDFVPPEDHELVIEASRKALHSSERAIHQVRFRVQMADGSLKHVDARFRRLPEPDATTIAGVLRDVETQALLAERLEAERVRLRSIVESSGAVVLLADGDLAIVVANSGFAELTGVPVEQAVGRKVRDILDLAITGPKLQTSQLTCRHTDPAGRQRVLGFTIKPVLDANGAVKQFVFVGVDDTDRREAEQALFAAERLAVVGEMSATLAHEIAQPLQVINFACSSAFDEVEAAQTSGRAVDLEFLEARLQRIMDQVERGTKIVSDLRSFVHGLAESEPRPFDPAEALRTAIGLVDHALREAQVKISLALDDPLPRVHGDAGKLEQVFVNLINNARDSGGSSVEVSARVERQADGRDGVRISIEDDGSGINDAVRGRLFDAFVTTKPRGKGTGLGLRICRRIIEEMGGTISGGNRPGGGARFDVLLPAV